MAERSLSGSTRPLCDDGRVTGWTLLVPVKDLSRAKSRLRPPHGASRRDLAVALARDTLRAAGALDGVAVVLVTDDAEVARVLRADADRVVAHAPVGLNAALASAAAGTSGPVAAMTADLPALTPDALGEALDAAGRTAYAVVPDAAGTGTTLLAATDPTRFRPRFGPGSRRAHEADEAVLLSGAQCLRQDVDTAEDLWRAVALGVGPATAALLAGLPPACVPGRGGARGTG
jgi:2-phospho-L-lactate guanylyltransferase